MCVVFEKVNTGGKALDALELFTAMYAAEGYGELRKDWYGYKETKGRHRLFAETLRPAQADTGIIANVSNTDFLQAVSLFYTRERRREAENAGKKGKELPAVTGNRQALLNLPLQAYKRYEAQVESGFIKAAKFLHMLHIYRIFDLPHQSQIVPLAAILADIGDASEHDTNRTKLVKWYWYGVFGELYSSAVETRIARDFMEVPAWLNDGPEPLTVSETMFRADRLKTMRMRLSAAYKGVNALLMKVGAQDFHSGQKFDHIMFFDENVDIHHVFPQDWCRKKRSSLPFLIPLSIRHRFPTKRIESSVVKRHSSILPNWKEAIQQRRRSCTLVGTGCRIPMQPRQRMCRGQSGLAVAASCSPLDHQTFPSQPVARIRRSATYGDQSSLRKRNCLETL